jgi:DNA-binding MarR family transcriptional regulator
MVKEYPDEETRPSTAGYASRVSASRLTETELRAWQALLHSHHDLVERLDAELRNEHDVTFNEYDVLLRLGRSSGRALRMTELAERVMLSPSGITRLIDRLIDKGLVSRNPDDDDARATLATLTEEGVRRLRLAARTHLRGIREHFTSRFSERQLRQLASTLEVIAGPHHPH